MLLKYFHCLVLLIAIVLPLQSLAKSGSTTVSYTPSGPDGVAYTTTFQWKVHSCPGGFLVEIAETQSDQPWNYILLDGKKYFPNDPLTQGLQIKGYPTHSYRASVLNGAHRLGSFEHTYVQDMFRDSCYLAEFTKGAENIIKRSYPDEKQLRNELKNISISNIQITAENHNAKGMLDGLRNRVREKQRQEEATQKKAKLEAERQRKLAQEKQREQEAQKQQQLQAEQEKQRQAEQQHQQQAQQQQNQQRQQQAEAEAAREQYNQKVEERLKRQAQMRKQQERARREAQDKMAEQAYNAAVAAQKLGIDGSAFLSLGVIALLGPSILYPGSELSLSENDKYPKFEYEWGSSLGFMGMLVLGYFHFKKESRFGGLGVKYGTTTLPSDNYVRINSGKAEFTGITLSHTQYTGFRSGMMTEMEFAWMFGDNETNYTVRNAGELKTYDSKDMIAFHYAVGYWRHTSLGFSWSLGFQPLSVKLLDNQASTQVLGIRYSELEAIDENREDEDSLLQWLGPIHGTIIVKDFVEMKFTHDPISKDTHLGLGLAF